MTDQVYSWHTILIQSFYIHLPAPPPSMPGAVDFLLTLPYSRHWKKRWPRGLSGCVWFKLHNTQFNTWACYFLTHAMTGGSLKCEKALNFIVVDDKPSPGGLVKRNKIWKGDKHHLYQIKGNQICWSVTTCTSPLCPPE